MDNAMLMVECLCFALCKLVFEDYGVFIAPTRVDKMDYAKRIARMVYDCVSKAHITEAQCMEVVWYSPVIIDNVLLALNWEDMVDRLQDAGYEYMGVIETEVAEEFLECTSEELNAIIDASDKYIDELPCANEDVTVCPKTCPCWTECNR